MHGLYSYRKPAEMQKTIQLLLHLLSIVKNPLFEAMSLQGPKARYYISSFCCIFQKIP
jgi:hypothetical protein